MSDQDQAQLSGLTPSEESTINYISREISGLIRHIQDVPGHRSLALAATKLEEAQFWLEDRKRKKPTGSPAR